MKNVFVVAAMTAALSVASIASADSAEQFGNEGRLIFGADVPEICGLYVTKKNGDIDFEDRDERDEDEAVFVVRNNIRGTKSNITLETASVTEGMDAKNVSYEWEVNDGDDTDYTGVFQVGRKDKVSVEANYNGNVSDVYAGRAQILTDVTVNCSK